MRHLTALLLLGLVACASRPVPPPSSDQLGRLFVSGRSFPDFLAGVDSLQQDWHANYERAVPDSAVVAQVRALEGTWKLLVVAEAWCTDAVNTLPYIARLVDSSAGHLELRIVSSSAGDSVTATHRSFDGRQATPTLVLLDGDSQERGCWVERPHELGLWARANKKTLSEADYAAQKAARYAADAGASTLKEISQMLAGAGAGRACFGNAH